MSWVEARFTLPASSVDLASAVLSELGTAGVQEESEEALVQPWEQAPVAPAGEVRLRAWFPAGERARLERLLPNALANVPGAGPVTWHEVADQSWDERWKESFAPIRASERFVVAPPWDAPAGAIVIEPGQGFGTGQHPSTRACLAALDAIQRADPDARTALDVGCGSGVLAIAAARLGLQVRGIDVEEAALADAARNAARNGVAISVSATPVARVTEPADVVLANVHAEVLVELAPELVRLTKRWLVLGGILADREEMVRGAFRALAPEARRVEERWVALVYRAAAR